MLSETAQAGYINSGYSCPAKTRMGGTPDFGAKIFLAGQAENEADAGGAETFFQLLAAKNQERIAAQQGGNSAAQAANRTRHSQGNGTAQTANRTQYSQGNGTAQAADAARQSQENGTQTAETEERVRFDYQKFFEDTINEMQVKLKNGENEPSFQIGAQSFTQKEWDKFLAKFDAIEDTIRKLMREEIEKRIQKHIEQQLQKQQEASEEQSSLLTAETTSCAYPPADPKEEEVRYVTWYTTDDIYCRKMGQTEEYEWTVPLDGQEQYDKIMDLIGQFPSDWNLRFAAHENFWTDFLNDRIAVDAFLTFMKGTENGVPDYTVMRGDTMQFDRDKMQWAKYLNLPGNQLYTSEEFRRLIETEIAQNLKNETRQSV